MDTNGREYWVGVGLSERVRVASNRGYSSGLHPRLSALIRGWIAPFPSCVPCQRFGFIRVHSRLLLLSLGHADFSKS